MGKWTRILYLIVAWLFPGAILIQLVVLPSARQGYVENPRSAVTGEKAN